MLLETLVFIAVGLVALLPPHLFIIAGEPQLISSYQYDIPIENENAKRLRNLLDRKGGLVFLAALFYLPFLSVPLVALVLFSEITLQYILPGIWFGAITVYIMNTGTLLAFIIKWRRAVQKKASQSELITKCYFPELYAA